MSTIAKLVFQAYVMLKGGVYLLGMLVVLSWLPFAFLCGLLLLFLGWGMSRMLSRRFGRIMMAAGIAMIIAWAVGQNWLRWGHDSPSSVSGMIQQVRAGHVPPTSGGALFMSTPPNPAGHQYLALNRTSCRNPASSYAHLQQDMDSDFSFNARALEGNNSVVVGKHFILGVPPTFGISHIRLLQNEVYVSAMGRQNFTLHTADATASTGEETWLSLLLDPHIFKGTAVHGFVKDSTGTVWMFQIGNGEPNEKAALQMLNYAVSDWMWSQMAKNASSTCH